MRKVVIGAGSGFWGDSLEPAVDMVERSDVQYVGFDHLSELSMAILNRMKAKDAERGYVPDVVPWMRALLPTAARRGVRLITNAGGANPMSAAIAVAAVAREAGVRCRIGVVEGDDVLERLPELRAQGWSLANLDTGEADLPDHVRSRLVAANVYTGSSGIIEQLQTDADVVIAGRVSDNALYVAPIAHELGWSWDEAHVNRIAAAITVGHVIECAACVTGGMSTQWQRRDPSREVGFPIAEFFENGEAVITKTPGSGGLVDEWTVKEHLLYEIGDPRDYRMPDGVADFTSVQLRSDGADRVRLSNITGAARPAHAKAVLAYSNGWIGEGMAFFPWPDALGKAKFAAEWMRARLNRLALPLEDLRIDVVGVNMLHGDAAPAVDHDLNEVGVRVAARSMDKAAADAIRREITHLWTMGPVGTSIAPPARVRPVVSLWPTLVPWEVVEVQTRQVAS